MGENRRSCKIVAATAGGRHGRQEQRSGRDLAKHDPRGGEGVQLLRQSGEALPGMQHGGVMEKYLSGMTLPSRAQMVGMAERLQSIEGQLNEIKAQLHQLAQTSGARQGGYPVAPKPPRTKRPPSTGE